MANVIKWAIMLSKVKTVTMASKNMYRCHFYGYVLINATSVKMENSYMRSKIKTFLIKQNKLVTRESCLIDVILFYFYLLAT